MRLLTSNEVAAVSGAGTRIITVNGQSWLVNTNGSNNSRDWSWTRISEPATTNQQSSSQGYSAFN